MDCMWMSFFCTMHADIGLTFAFYVEADCVHHHVNWFLSLVHRLV